MSKYLYIFPHIQKTAGSTIRYHIRKNLKKDEWLLLNRKNLRIEKNVVNIGHKRLLNLCGRYIKSLDKRKKEKINVIFGAWVPYGVHEFFPGKTPRYFTFVRKPLSRTVSLYNHRRYIVEEEKEDLKIQQNAKEYLLVDGKIPDFKTWLKNKYNLKDPSTSMYIYLKNMGYINSSCAIKRSIKKCLNIFYFVGTLQTYSEDSLYLYHKMGFKAYLLSQNVSKKYFDPVKNEDSLREMLRKKNGEDFLLYEEAAKKNVQFKVEHPDFENIVKIEKVTRKFLLPFTQVIYAPLDTVKLIGKKIINALDIKDI